jgi:hypothetical protein
VTADAIRSFAKAAMLDRGRQRPRAPQRVVLEASVQNGDDAAEPLSEAGWTRTSRTEFTIEARRWRDDGETIDAAISAAAGAAWQPYSFTFDGVDPTTRESGLAVPKRQLAATERVLTAWSNDRTVEWITPESAVRWEGLPHGAPGVDAAE